MHDLSTANVRSRTQPHFTGGAFERAAPCCYIAYPLERVEASSPARPSERPALEAVTKRTNGLQFVGSWRIARRRRLLQASKRRLIECAEVAQHVAKRVGL
jgi:hypothetical protein